MIHILEHQGETNATRRFWCGIVGKLPEGDTFYYESEAERAGFRDDPVCPGCFPNGKPEIGTPISQLSGRPGEKGYEEFCRIASSWGHP